MRCDAMHACTAATKSNKNKYYYCEIRVSFHSFLPHFSSFFRLLTRLLIMEGMNGWTKKWIKAKRTTATDSAEWRGNKKKRTRKFEKWFENCLPIHNRSLSLRSVCVVWCEVAQDDQRWTECDTSSLVKCHLCGHIFQSKRDTIVFSVRLLFAGRV